MTHSLDIHRPFSRADALAAGIEPQQLESSQFRRIFRGVYVDSSVEPTPAVRAEAALVPFHPTAFASHASAARLLGLPIPTIADEHVTVFERRHRRNRAGIRCHLVASAHLQVIGGVRLSSYEQVFVELGELLSLVDLVVVGDHLVRKGHTSPERLRSFCEQTTSRGASHAQLAASYVRERVDSPMETRLRMLIVLAGLPEPEVNRIVRDEFGVPVRRYDLSYPSSRTAVEYDGRHHIEREDQWESDLERREASDGDGYRLLVVIAKGIYLEPERTLLRIWRVLRERGEAGVPAVLSDDWRPHFPSRGRAA